MRAQSTIGGAGGPWAVVVALVAATVMLGPSTAWAPVEYVKVCSQYGAGFYYIPGTDVCVNPTTGETRQETAGGTWYGHLPSPGTWVNKPQGACTGGQLVKLGTFTFSDLTLNASDKYQTEPIPLTLGSNEFIANVILSGGFTATDKSTFCLSFYDAATGAYALLGCENTKPLRDQPVLFSFAPLTTIPPANFTPPFKLVGYNANETWGLSSFEGALTSWVCVQKAK